MFEMAHQRVEGVWVCAREWAVERETDKRKRQSDKEEGEREMKAKWERM